MPLKSGKSDVVVESDQQNRGTPYRTCSILVYRSNLDSRQMDRIRSALSGIVSSPEIALVAAGRPTVTDSRRFVRLRMVYYGKQLPSESILQAIQDVL